MMVYMATIRTSLLPLLSPLPLAGDALEDGLSTISCIRLSPSLTFWLVAGVGEVDMVSSGEAASFHLLLSCRYVNLDE